MGLSFHCGFLGFSLDHQAFATKCFYLLSHLNWQVNIYFILFYGYGYGCFACICVCVPQIYLVPANVRRGCWILWTRSYTQRELPCGLWELNLRFLEEQPVLLSAETSLQALNWPFIKKHLLFVSVYGGARVYSCICLFVCLFMCMWIHAAVSTLYFWESLIGIHWFSREPPVSASPALAL